MRSSTATIVPTARTFAHGHRARTWRGACIPVLVTIASLFCAPRVRAGECLSEDERACPKPLAAETSRGIGLATGLRASAVSTSALAYSPAALGLGSLYHIEGNVDYMSDPNTVALGAAVVDSSTSMLGAGFALRGFLSGEQGFDGVDGRLGLGVKLSEAFSLGLAGRYLDVRLYADNGGGDVVLLDDAQGFTMDASLRVVPVQGLQIDVAALNFVDRDSPLVPLTVTGGAAFSIASSFSVGADVIADLSTFDAGRLTLGGGFEYLGGNSVPLRAGYSFDLARKIHAVAAGVGYTDQHIGLDIGIRQELTRPGPLDPETRIMAAIRYYVN